jgi:two-component system, cell cycle sensor histidine kinase and response regulator CckA
MSISIDSAKNLLIIDHDPGARIVLQQLLNSSDYTLTFASTGADGLAKAAELMPDLILLDVMMPGMDGFAVCRKIRDTPDLADIPIILLTAPDDHRSRLRGLEAGADDCISKRFDFVELQTRVRTITRLNRYRRLLMERAKFERVVELAPNGVLLVDMAGTIHLTNPAALHLLGSRQRNQVLGQLLRNFVVSEHYDRWAAAIRHVLSDSAHTVRVEADCIRLDGSTVPVEVDIGPFVRETQPLAQLIVRDVTERRRAEIALRQSEQRFHTLFENAPDAIFVVGHDGVVRDVNPAACRLYGLTQERLLGKLIVDLVLLDRRSASAQCLFLLARGGIDHLEGFSTTADGRTLSVEVRASQIDGTGAPGLLVQVRDITERKQLEVQLVQAQRMEGVGRLASGVAHDFNNLLTVIGGYANLALEQLAPADPLYDDLYEVRTVVDRAARLTHRLLAFARQQEIEPQILNLNDQILDLGSMLRRLIGKDIELVYKLAPDLALIKADPSQIEQLLVNLVVNARDAMPEGGKVEIETHNVEVGHASLQPDIRVLAPGAVCLVVRDTGIGMNDAVKRRLFELFYTTKALGQGTGVGLATCYAIVKQHGGHIEVDSEIGQGSTFTIYLPVVSRGER